MKEYVNDKSISNDFSKDVVFNTIQKIIEDQIDSKINNYKIEEGEEEKAVDNP